jgi:hypothetical protein
MVKFHKTDLTRPPRGAVRPRLTKALETLTQEGRRPRPIVTVTELCRLADVSRGPVCSDAPCRRHESGFA